MVRRRNVKAPDQEARHVKHIEVGGTYRDATGINVTIYGRTPKGLMGGVTEHGNRMFFYEDGTSADGRGLRINWWSLRGPEGWQRTALKRLAH